MWKLVVPCLLVTLLLSLPRPTSSLLSFQSSRRRVTVPQCDTPNCGVLFPFDAGSVAASASAPRRFSTKHETSASSFIRWYESSLQLHPFRTKCLSSAVIGCLGNIISQSLQAIVARKSIAIDPHQVGAFGLIGLLYVGPFYHYWFDQLSRLASWLESRYGSSRQKQVLTQLLLDQTIGVVLFFPLYFSSLRLLMP
jgi:hypothetical protein